MRLHVLAVLKTHRKPAASAAPETDAESRGADEGAPRLQNVLAQRGLASRRRAADIIRSGRVAVNGELVTEPGRRVEVPADRVTVDGRELHADRPALRTIMMNKPVGEICSADSRQGRTVCERVAHLPERLVPVGRLDRDSEGLLLLSNDGDLIAAVTHPRHRHRKRYEVDVSGPLDEAVLRRLAAPFDLDGYRTRPAEVSVLLRGRDRHRLAITLSEGRNRQIRRMCGAVGLGVIRLMRVAIDGLQLGRLSPGEWRELTDDEIASLKGS